jgi:hypothetical protein
MRWLRSSAAALLLFAGLTAGVQAQTAPKPLSPWDAQLYAAAFDAAERGAFADAEAQALSASDPSLRGALQARRLLSSEAKAPYAELAAWLQANADHPDAPRVHALALKRRPAGAPSPAAPLVSAGARRWADLAGRPQRVVEGRQRGGTERARTLLFRRDPGGLSRRRPLRRNLDRRPGRFPHGAFRRSAAAFRSGRAGWKREPLASRGGGLLGRPSGHRGRLARARARVPAPGGGLPDHLLRPDR